MIVDDKVGSLSLITNESSAAQPGEREFQVNSEILKLDHLGDTVES